MYVPRTSIIPASVSPLSNSSPTSPNYINRLQMAFPSNSPPISSHDPPSRDGDTHIAKRIKMESPSAALDSNIDPFVPFEDDTSNLGSFEIDYSKFYGPAGQARLLMQSTPRLGSGFYTEPACPAGACSAAATLTEELLDDSAFEHAFSDDEDMMDSTITDEPLAEPVRQPFTKDAIYSAPSSCDKPHLGPQPATATGGLSATDKLTDGHAWDMIRQSGNFVLTPEERRQLIEIAMGPPRHFYAYKSPTTFGTGVGYPNPMQPNPISQQYGIGNDAAALRLCAERSRPSPFEGTRACVPPSLPRADRNPGMDSTAVSETMTTLKRPLAEAGAKVRSADRLAHNDVERKYRTNLKDKITELRNAVPALQQDYSTETSAAPSTKVSKGTVLTKATEYIHQLEQRNQEIMTEHQYLVRRLQAFETLLNSSMCSSDMIPSHSMTLFDPRGFC